jgi:molybdopterin converting factor subunit 1
MGVAMTVHVRLFARARDLAETASVCVELPAAATVADLRHVLAKTHPALAALLPRCAVAVDDDFAGDDRPLSPSSEIALLPPVSGG